MTNANTTQTSGRYEVLCDDCKATLRTTDSLPESAAGGRCLRCRPDFVAEGDGCPSCGERDVDRLVWHDDDTHVRCDCGRDFVPGDETAVA